VAKLKPNEKRVQLSFLRPEDVALFEWMAAKAYAARLTLPDFILLSLQQAFPEGDRDAENPPASPE
jgi:hypothetical protein